MRMSLIADVSQFKSDKIGAFDTGMRSLFNSIFTKYNLPDHFMHHRQRSSAKTPSGMEFIQWEIEYDAETSINAHDIISFSRNVLELHQQHLNDARLVLEVNRTIIGVTRETVEGVEFGEVIGTAIHKQSLDGNGCWML